MCYKYPGPRCSSHAKKYLDKAVSALYDAISNGESVETQIDLNNKVIEAQKHYYMTPAGQKELREQIEETGDPDGSLAYKLEYGIEARKIALEQSKRKDIGDVNEENGVNHILPETKIEESNPYSQMGLEEVNQIIAERTSSEEFKSLLELRDNAREARSALDKKIEERKEYFAQIDAISAQPYKNHKFLGGREATEEEINEAIDQLDPTFEDLRQLNNERLESHYDLSIKNNDVEEYKNLTALAVARKNELLGDPGIPYEENRLGHCVPVATYDSGTREWLEERQHGIGGSDVGSFLQVDPEYGRENYQEAIKSKIEKYTDEEVAEQAEANSGFSGPAGRGNAWEPEIVRRFEKEHPELGVFFSKTSWAHENDPRKKCNVDGLLASDGKTVDGILEIKTASHRDHWYSVDEHGNEVPIIPVGYRAQVLWYMHNTGFKYAKVAAMIDDNEYVERTIYADEYIDPSRPELGTMEENVPKLESIWETQVEEVKKNGKAEPTPKKYGLADAHLAKNIETSVRQFSAWSDLSHAESEAVIKGYASYKKEAKSKGERILNRDAYMVEQYKKYGPDTWKRDRVYVDIETSGSSYGTGEIIEVGIVRVKNGEIIDRYHERYGLKSEKALEINGTGFESLHGISRDDIRGKRNFNHPEVQQVMKKHLLDPDAVMIAHNEVFERRWFDQHVDGFHETHSLSSTAYRRAKYEGNTDFETFTTQDTMYTSKKLVHHTKNNKLATFTEGHGIPYLDAHRADVDSEMTMEANNAFSKLFKTAPKGHRWNPEGEYNDDDVYEN